MEKKDELMDGLSSEELQREADEIRAIIDSEPDLQDVYVTDEMHRRMVDRIWAYEEKKAIENLSEENKEALRLGKELQRKRHRRKKRVWLLLVASMVLVLGMSIASMGGRNVIVEVFERTFGSGDKTYVDSGKDTIPVDGITEEQAYEDIKKIFGSHGVEMLYKPNGAKFLRSRLNKKAQEAILYYSVGNNIMSLHVVSRYVNSSLGMEIQDNLLRKYELELPETTVQIKEYRIAETEELEYRAEFIYGDCKYSLIGIVEKAEFEKIVKNLYFF